MVFSTPVRLPLSAGYRHADEMRDLLRIAFYKALKRRPPTLLVSLPSYVSAVKKHYSLPSGNEARNMLARIEGFENWKQWMRAALVVQLPPQTTPSNGAVVKTNPSGSERSLKCHTHSSGEST